MFFFFFFFVRGSPVSSPSANARSLLTLRGYCHRKLTLPLPFFPDAVQTEGFEAAIERCLAFREVGCDMTFLEAPETIDQMAEYCRRVPGPKLANMLEHGSTPILPPRELKQMGYTMAAYPLTLLSASIKAMEESLDCLRRGVPTDPHIVSFAQTKDAVGFTRYADEERRYRTIN